MVTSTAGATLDWQIQLYPNPTSGDLFLEIIRPTLAFDGLVRIYDQLGRQLFSIEVAAAARVHQTVDLGSWPAGVYLLRFTDEGGNAFSRKILKQ